MKRLHQITDRATGELRGWTFDCPGCTGIHEVTTAWAFNGDLERPTFSPSLLCSANFREPTDPPGTPLRRYVCHSFVRDGRIEFLGDCTHALAGQTVDLADIPEASP